MLHKLRDNQMYYNPICWVIFDDGICIGQISWVTNTGSFADPGKYLPYLIGSVNLDEVRYSTFEEAQEAVEEFLSTETPEAKSKRMEEVNSSSNGYGCSSED